MGVTPVLIVPVIDVKNTVTCIKYGFLHCIFGFIATSITVTLNYNQL
jgi:hypothetical protein